MKVRIPLRTVAAAGRTLAATAAALLLITAMSPAPASAITRPEVISRANSWVKKGVMYSQSANYGGYRRDCSGFVSMTWKLSTSYTTRTIASRARRIPLSALRPGDAVLQRGHVQLFAGWVSRRAGTYVALEESSRGKPAHRKIKRLPRGGVGLRFAGIEEAPVAPVAPSAALAALDSMPPVRMLPLHVLPSNPEPTAPSLTSYL